MQEFIPFEPSLTLSKDARSPGPCTDLAPATRAHRRAANSKVAFAAGSPKNRPLRADVVQALLGGGPGDGEEVLGHPP